MGLPSQSEIADYISIFQLLFPDPLKTFPGLQIREEDLGFNCLHAYQLAHQNFFSHKADNSDWLYTLQEANLPLSGTSHFIIQENKRLKFQELAYGFMPCLANPFPSFCSNLLLLVLVLANTRLIFKFQLKNCF